LEAEPPPSAFGAREGAIYTTAANGQWLREAHLYAGGAEML
tara:strand:+ start:748 stop:870 length:123 start_codon:yes stop_codon:yes gene_type:complete